MKLELTYLLLPVLFLPGTLVAQEIQKADNTTTLSSTGAWAGGAVPGPGNVARWDSLYNRSPNLASTLGASMSWAGIKVTDPQQSPRIRNTAGATLTLGSAGVDMSAATKDFDFLCGLALGASQTWNIAADRTLSSNLLAGGAGLILTKSGDGTLALTGATTLAANLAIDGGLVRVAPASGTAVFSGSISGSGELLKDGAGALTLSGNNGGFNGTLRLLAGTLNLNSAAALGGTNFLLSGGTLDNTSGGPLTLTGGSQTWSGNFAFGGTNNLDLGTSQVTVSGTCGVSLNAGTLTASTITGPGAADNLIIGGAGTLAAPAGRSISMGGKLGVSGGNLGISGGEVECGLSTGTLEIGGGGLVKLTGGTLRVRAITRSAGGAQLALDGGTLVPVADSNTFVSGLDSAWVGAAGAVIDVDGWWVGAAQGLRHDSLLGDTPDGGLTVRDTSGGGKLTLNGACTYTGPTAIEGGTLVIGVGGSIATSPVIEVMANGVFDAGAGVTLAAGQVLRGTGGVAGKLTVGAGATLSPGTAATPYTAIDMTGAALSLKGTAEFGIRKTGGGIDSVFGLSRVTYGGTLKVTAAPGTFFQNGDRFALFDADTYAGGFAGFDLPALPAGLFWETAGLTEDGNIEVTNLLPRPTFSPPAGTYVGSLSIAISGVTGSTIHYTTDGSDPLTSPTVVTEPSPVTGVPVAVGSSGYTLRAYTSLPGFNSSVVATAVYTTLVNPTWSLDGSGSWQDAENWISGVVASGSGVTADFSTLAMSGPIAVANNAALTIGGMIFGDTGETHSWTVNGSSLTLAATAQPVVTVKNGVFTTNVGILGTQGFTKTGAGQWNFNGDQPISGPVVVTGGTLRAGGGNTARGALGRTSSFTIGNATVISAGDNGLMGWEGRTSLPVTLNPGGVLTCTDGAASNLWEIVLAGGDFSSAATTHGTFGSWNVQRGIVATEDSTISARNIQFTSATVPPGVQVAAGKTVTVSGFFSNFNANTVVIPFTKSGPGTLLMNGANTYTGATAVSEGAMLVNGSLAAGSAVTVSSGATFGGSGTAPSAVTVPGGAILAPGHNGVGTLTTGALTLGGTYQCEVSGATADRVTVNGNLSLANSTLMVSAIGAAEAGTRVIASYTGTRSGTFGGTLPAGYSLDYDDTAKEVRLTVPGGGDPYGTWTQEKGLTAANNGKGQDPDGDGVSNLLEFYLGGEPLTANSAILPRVVAMDTTTVTFGFFRLDEAEAAFPTQRFPYGTNLTVWTPVTIGTSGGPGPNGIIVNIAENGAAPDWITVVIPRALATSGKLFGRLHLSEQAP